MNCRVFVLTLCFCALSTVGWATTTVFTAGVEDGFALPSEPASASADALATVDQSVSSDFDLVEPNFSVIQTFAGLPSGITNASLRLRVKGNPNVNSTGNGGDGLILFFSDSAADDLAADLVWSRTFGATTSNGALFTDNDPGLIVSGAWTGTSDESITLDLGALPLAGGGTFNLLPQLNAAGFLDVLSGDDSTTDFMELTVIVPEPSTATLLVVGSLLIARRRQRS